MLSSRISTAPDAVLSWASDVFGNAVTTATFSLKTSTLVISNAATVQLALAEWPIFDIAASAISYPFLYSDHDWVDLGALTTLQSADIDGTLRNWAQMFVRGSQTDTLALLKDLSAGVSEAARYQSREEEGTQTPLETLSRGWGSCRDLAMLFADAARVLGFGARVVSGYLYNPAQQSAGSGEAGATHAWAEIFLPGAGWITFDPTKPHLGRVQLGTDRRGARHPPDCARVGQLHRQHQRLRWYVSRGPGHLIARDRTACSSKAKFMREGRNRG